MNKRRNNKINQKIISGLLSVSLIAGLSTIDVTVANADSTYEITSTNYEKGYVAAKELRFTTENFFVNVGDKVQVTYNVLPENATYKDVSWKSSDTDIATVDKNGVVTGKKDGIIELTGTTKDGVSEYCYVIVNNIPVSNIKFSSSNISIVNVSTKKINPTISPENATDKTLLWTSYDDKIGTVNSKGEVKAKSVGTTTIVALASVGGVETKCTVKVTPAPVTGVKVNKAETSVFVGASETLKSTVSPSNAENKAVTWSSSDTSIVTVDSNGKIKGIKAGTAEVTATTKDGKKKSTCKVKVNNVNATSIKVNKTSASIYAGDSVTLTATVKPDNTTNKNIKWSTSDSTIATVDKNGTVTGKKKGIVQITATTKDGAKSTICEVMVSDSTANGSGWNKSIENKLLKDLSTANTNNTDPNSQSYIMPKSHFNYLNGISNSWVNGKITANKAYT